MITSELRNITSEHFISRIEAEKKCLKNEKSKKRGHGNNIVFSTLFKKMLKKKNLN